MPTTTTKEGPIDMAKRIISPFAGEDITARVEALTERLRAINHRLHAQRAPGCTTWERYGIPAYEDRRRTGLLRGEGCQEHGIFLSMTDG